MSRVLHLDRKAVVVLSGFNDLRVTTIGSRHIRDISVMLVIAREGHLSRTFEAGKDLRSVRLHSLGWEVILGQEVGPINNSKMGDGVGRKSEVASRSLFRIEYHPDCQISNQVMNPA